MSGASDYYEVQIAECTEQAAAKPLANVRDRCLRPKAAWQAMLDREKRSIVMRADRPTH